MRHARFLTAEGVPLIEVDRPESCCPLQHGKFDTIDAEQPPERCSRAAHRAPPRPAMIEAIRVHQVVHRSVVRDRTAAINQFHAVVVSAPAEIRQILQQIPLKQRLKKASRWRDRARDDTASRAASRQPNVPAAG